MQLLFPFYLFRVIKMFIPNILTERWWVVLLLLRFTKPEHKHRKQIFMKHKDITHEIVDQANKLRKQQTQEEGKLWHLYLKKINPRFTRQKIIGSYIVDFYCAKLKLIIEIDGEQHYLDENKEYEKRREEYLQGLGYKLLRFYNSDINKSLKNTETTIYHSCINRAEELGIDVEISFK